MSKTRSRLWDFDFAGHHGTAWGTFNLGLTVVTVTTCAYVFAAAPWWAATAIMGFGFVLTLMRAAFRTKPVHPVTVIYQLACWAASGAWASWMLQRESWTFKSWCFGVIVWAGVALVAGIALGLGREDRPATRNSDEPPTVPASTDGLTQGERDALGEVALDAINMLAGNPKPEPVPGKEPRPWKSYVQFTALQAWKTGFGYTIEGSFTGGQKFGLNQLQALMPALAQELNLPYGCTAVAREHPGEGAGRRDFLLDITTRNALLDDQPFPLNEGPFTINDGLPIGRDSKGDRFMVYLREKCLAVYGGTGSGKTGTMKGIAGILALTSDCIMVGIDATGGDLVRPMLKPYENGDAEFPAFSAVAVSYVEAERLSRALLRIAYARKAAYQHILDEHNTTLLPMGAIVRRADLAPKAREYFPIPADNERMIPQVMLLGDETRDYLCTSGAQPVLRELITRIIRETRGAGVRCVFGPLGPSNANIDQSIQDLLRTNIAMMLGKNSDFRDALGGGTVQVGDFPMRPDGSGKVPGVGFAVLERGQQETQIRMWGEMKPDIVNQIAIRASENGWIPDLDYISELAADGFNPDGTPMRKQAGLFQDGDEFYWRDRWLNWNTRKGQKENNEPKARPDAQPKQTVQSATATMEKLREKVASTEQAVDARVAEVTGSTPEEVAFDRALVEQAAEKWPATIPAEWAGESQVPESRTWRDRVMAAIREAGAGGINPGALEKIDGVVRSELYKFLAAQCAQGRLYKPSKGMYAVPEDER